MYNHRSINCLFVEICSAQWLMGAMWLGPMWLGPMWLGPMWLGPSVPD
jgi:hypothetical protein